MGHIVTGIPPRSRVSIYAQGRFRQFKQVVDTGAVAISATAEAYPLRVNVQPSMVAAGTRGLMNYGNAGPDGIPMPVNDSSLGPVTDYMISTPDDKYVAGSPRLLVTRHRGAFMQVHLVKAPNSPETDIYERRMCVECGGVCGRDRTVCVTCRPPEPLCSAMRLTESGVPSECTNPRFEKFEVCYMHAEEQGLLAKAASKPAKSEPKPGKRGRHPSGCQCEKHAVSRSATAVHASA